VQAANNDGIWNTAGAAFSFELRPHFYQTLWFYALLLLALGGAVLLVLKRRLYVAEREFKAVLGERSRIAREIHDTLAQGYVGVSVQLEVLAELLRQQKEDARRTVGPDARLCARWAGRCAAVDLGAAHAGCERDHAAGALRRIAEAAGGDRLTARFSIFGAYRPLRAETEGELMRVAQEAIHNVKKHAGASQLWVQLEYGPEMDYAGGERRRTGRRIGAGDGNGPAILD
jgi:hypothetical protein